jgi:hypothetical protein
MIPIIINILKVIFLYIDIYDEKKYVAKDYISSGSFWQNEKDSITQKYFKICLFYMTPFITTAVFSIFLYPRAVYVVKKLFKLKSFFGINLVI